VGISGIYLPEVAALRTSLASRTVFEVLGLDLGFESQVLGLGIEPSRSSKIGLSSVDDNSFLPAFKSYIFTRCKIVIVSFKTQE